MAPPTRRYFIIIIIMLALLSLIFSLSKGSTSASLYQLFFAEKASFYGVILHLRLARTVAAFVCGGLLALAGVLMQLLLQNPLADPYVLGISGGAALGTLLLMLLGVSAEWLIPGAWAGSLASIFLILMLGRKHGWQTHSLLLTGVALACGFSAINSFILLISPADNLHNMLFWLAGDLNDTQLPWAGLIVLTVGFCMCLLLAPGMDILARGEIEAKALGLAAQRYRFMLYILSSLFTACAVTIAGSIGFIGLIIPHLSRRLIGFNHCYALPVSLLLGGSLLTIADSFARSLFAPAQLPVGILIAMLGVPVFIWLLRT